MQTSYGLVAIGWVQSALKVLEDAPDRALALSRRLPQTIYRLVRGLRWVLLLENGS
jgi:hypothetical protein